MGNQFPWPESCILELHMVGSMGMDLFRRHVTWQNAQVSHV
jgi:hypothetical protein